VVASCRGNLWRFKAERVLAKFERATGMLLSRDLTVLLKIAPTFHPQYGFSLNIEDIDPSYTLGDLAQQYAAMIDRLTGEGLLRLNAQLPAPFDIEHVIVIAPEKAAGLGDFRADADRLARTGACHFIITMPPSKAIMVPLRFVPPSLLPCRLLINNTTDYLT